MTAMCEAQNQILEVFWWHDEKEQGVITRKELARVLKKLSPEWSDQQVDRLVQLAQPSSDGLIKYKDFIAWLMGTAGGPCDGPSPQPGVSSTEAKQLEAEALANNMARDMELAERVSAEANDLLEAALPALDAATAALDSLDDKDFAVLAAVSEPPAGVAAVATCLSVLLGKEGACTEPGKSGWAHNKAMLTEEGFRTCLRDFNKDGVTEDPVEAVRALLNTDEDLMSNLGIERMRATSLAGHGLLLWVLAVVRYHEAALAASPRFQKVNKLHHRMCRAEAKLATINAEVEKLKAAT